MTLNWQFTAERERGTSTRGGAYFVLSAPSLKQRFVTLVNKLKGGGFFFPNLSQIFIYFWCVSDPLMPNISGPGWFICLSQQMHQNGFGCIVILWGNSHHQSPPEGAIFFCHSKAESVTPAACPCSYISPE